MDAGDVTCWTCTTPTGCCVLLTNAGIWEGGVAWWKPLDRLVYSIPFENRCWGGGDLFAWEHTWLSKRPKECPETNVWNSEHGWTDPCNNATTTMHSLVTTSSQDIIAYSFMKKPNHFFADIWDWKMSSHEQLRVLLVFWLGRRHWRHILGFWHEIDKFPISTYLVSSANLLNDMSFQWCNEKVWVWGVWAMLLASSSNPYKTYLEGWDSQHSAKMCKDIGRWISQG